MVQIGVAHGRVLAHDVHAAHLVWIGVIGQGLVHDFNDRVARLIVKRGVPKLFKPVVCLSIANPLIVGVHHWDESGIAGTLHIVLTAQWMQARTRLANLTRDGGQCNQATCVVGAVNVLADPHAPENHGGFAGGKFARYFAQCFCWNAANGRHGLRAIALDVLLQRFVVVGARLNEVLVYQAFFNDGVDQGVEHGHIGVGLELQSSPGMLANVGDTRICQDNFGASFGCVFHPSGSHGVIGRGVGADDKNEACMFNVIDLIADRCRAHAF